jgi:hypothetical protein
MGNHFSGLECNMHCSNNRLSFILVIKWYSYEFNLLRVYSRSICKSNTVTQLYSAYLTEKCINYSPPHDKWET